MRKQGLWICAIPVVLVLAFVLGDASQAQAPDYAFVENRTGETMVLVYNEIISGNEARTSVQIYPNQTKRLDPAAIDGEVCLWDAREGTLEPAEKVACRRLSPGETWVLN